MGFNLDDVLRADIRQKIIMARARKIEELIDTHLKSNALTTNDIDFLNSYMVEYQGNKTRIMYKMQVLAVVTLTINSDLSYNLETETFNVLL